MSDASEPRRAAGPADAAIVPAALVPALIDQATTDTSGAAWLGLGLYCAVAAVALTVRRRWPLTALGCLLTALATAEVVLAASETKLSPLAVLPLAFALYAVGAHTPPRRSVLALAGGAALTLIGVGVNHATAPDGWRGGSDVLALVAPLPAAWALGLATRGRRDLLAAAERRADDAQRDQRLHAERAAAAERGRIARDMHDVAAHSLTLLVVHAETLRARAGELPPWAREDIDAMAAAGRRATAEMRELLGVLRDETGRAAPRGPAPDLGGLPALVREAERAGTPVLLRLALELDRLGKPAQLAAYRLFQECLANARRHAPGAPVTLAGQVADGLARLGVHCGAPPAGHTPTPGAGSGLIGLRERVTALGGALAAAPAEDGGFEVTATLPTPEEPRV
ncbi:sensor histidine kinase [Streptomyces profundus]|uniref:sensor histidine kinase n=1 Tax=Streptomyces profundus TaxID=2867410 RepID=UPI001D161C35|nr:histidine kinase [Streptomyces sp. MA3_2.13]UED83925.1 two-component sensor histidine kinase [Streptomyces sp. MA3_2.13]